MSEENPITPPPENPAPPADEIKPPESQIEIKKPAEENLAPPPADENAKIKAVFEQLLKDSPEIKATLEKIPDLQTKLEQASKSLIETKAQFSEMKKEALWKECGIEPAKMADFRKLYPDTDTPEKIKASLDSSPWFKKTIIPGVEGGGDIKKPDQTGEFNYEKTKDPSFLNWVLGRR